MTTTSARIPVTILGGYLGAGKTTLVNHLLRNANGRRLAILVNDFGEIAIDADLIEAEEDDVISLSGGCVCCSYGNDLIMAMDDLSKMQPRPDHVILESSGVALPGAIANSVSLLHDYGVEGIVVLADAETVQQRANDKYIGDTITRQLDDADLLVLNKTDLVAEDQKAPLARWLADNFDCFSVIEAQRAQVDPEILLLEFDHDAAGYPPPHTHAGQHSTEFVRFEQPVDVAAFADELLQRSPSLVRAKGFVPDKDGSMKTLQITGRRMDITQAPATATPGLVTIYLNG